MKCLQNYDIKFDISLLIEPIQPSQPVNPVLNKPNKLIDFYGIFNATVLSSLNNRFTLVAQLNIKTTHHADIFLSHTFGKTKCEVYGNMCVPHHCVSFFTASLNWYRHLDFHAVSLM